LDRYPDAAQSGCLHCHGQIEPIREVGSDMLDQIVQLGAGRGDPAGCVVCHNGNPNETDNKDVAHGGDDFYPDPGSPWVNEDTCGQCHEDQVRVQWQSLMMTEAGKIQGTCWSFGALTGYQHLYANYAVENPKDPKLRLGTDAYRTYLERLKALEPNVFVESHEPLPEAVGFDQLDQLRDNPSLAAFTYIRQECNRCHHAVKGRAARGDYRGMGCSSCHIPYSNQGYYEGTDSSIPKDTPAHALTHQIQGTRDATVTIHGVAYQGIPAESLAVSFLHHVAQYTGQLPDTTRRHNDLLHKILLTSAWFQTLAAIACPISAAGLVWYLRRRRKRNASISDDRLKTSNR
jgi:hypothetical protein